ncbi:MAG: YgiT-type zinc finger protein [Deltaproteobacteria bacterium]|nr:YgiT-type zinc finger protein [Deltaproteobacteria bacterium]
MSCSRCEKAMHKTIGNHHYLESGLDNVYLENIPLYECPDCQIAYASFFRLGRLNDLIDLALVQKPALLNGHEIKFLRKGLRMPSHLFAKELGVGKTTLSKWENDLQSHSEAHDRLIRAIYIIEKGLRKKDQQAIQKFLRSTTLRDSISQYVIIAEKAQNDYVVRLRPMVESGSQFSLSTDSALRVQERSTSVPGTILGFKSVVENVPAFSQQEQAPPGAAAYLISEGTTPYGTQTTEI